METQTGGQERCGIGARLRGARERTGLTPVQAAERLHLDPHVIAALETETFESLGAPVYVRGHLKRYAELVGEPASELQQHYASSVQAAALPDLTRIPKAAPPAQRRRLFATGAALLVTIGVIGTSWWVLNLLRNASVLAPADEAAPEVSAPPISAPVAVAAPAAAGTDVQRRAVPAAVPATNLGPATPALRTSELTLRFAADSWVEVYDANGERLFFDVGTANSVRTVTGAAPLRVLVGNAAGVAVEVNGKPAVIPDNAVRDGEARFVVNRSGRLVRARFVVAGTTP